MFSRGMLECCKYPLPPPRASVKSVREPRFGGLTLTSAVTPLVFLSCRTLCHKPRIISCNVQLLVNTGQPISQSRRRGGGGFLKSNGSIRMGIRVTLNMGTSQPLSDELEGSQRMVPKSLVDVGGQNGQTGWRPYHPLGSTLLGDLYQQGIPNKEVPQCMNTVQQINGTCHLNQGGVGEQDLRERTGQCEKKGQC